MIQRDDDNDTADNLLAGTSKSDQRRQVNLCPVIRGITYRRSWCFGIEQCDFTLELHRTNLLSPNLLMWRFSSGPRLCDPGAVAIHGKLTDMKRESDLENMALKQAFLGKISTSNSFKDHNRKMRVETS